MFVRSRGKLGDALKDEFNFRSFDRIRDSYSNAFDRKFDSLVVETDRSLFNLAQIRNVIVHSAAVADEQFVRTMVETQSAFPEFKGVKRGDTVPIDGKIAARVINESFDSAVKFIAEVESLY